MKKLFLLFCFSFFVFHSAFGQSGTWTWISGSSATGAAGVYGTQGVPSVNNHPPADYEMVEWKDKQGNFWLYGGTTNLLNDLWKYNPSTNEWTWVNGTRQPSQAPLYGTQGVANIANTPGQRPFSALTWVDTTGDLWLFGGHYTSHDLWKYNIGSNMWTWVNGDASHLPSGKHGTMGVPGTTTVPGQREEAASTWTDSLNNLWLYSGYGYDDNAAFGYLGDVMKYDISTNEWTWMKGSNLVGAPVVYGTKGISNLNNDPGGRWSQSKWKDKQDNFWFMGGQVNSSALNDVWKYNAGSNEWTWMYGSTTPNDTGNYVSKCVFDTINMPAARREHRASVTDNCGRFWMSAGFQAGNTYNDLWVFDPQQLKWAWLGGQKSGSNYGTLGVPSPTNLPPTRMGADAWWGNDNRFYMWGGYFGSYGDLWVYTPDTTCISNCNTVSVLPPVADFQADKISICENDCINFTDLSSSATSWQWSFAGAIDSTSTTQNPQNICYLATGIYSVTLVASNSGGSDTLSINNYVTVNAAPPTPLISQINDTVLNFTPDLSYKSYQWYLDSAIIPNATDTFLVIHTSANYNLEITGINGCKISAGINVILGLQNYMSDGVISLWPNPVKDRFTVYGLRFTVSEIDIYNILGQVCKESAIHNPQSEISVSELPSGIYFVQLRGEKERWLGRFIKE